MGGDQYANPAVNTLPMGIIREEWFSFIILCGLQLGSLHNLLLLLI
jgi:hypothetical protein